MFVILHIDYIPTVTINAMLAGFKHIGLDVDRIMREIAIDPAILESTFSSIPEEIYAQIWIQAIKQDPRPDLPARCGVAVPAGAFGMFDHLVASCGTVGEGMQTLNLFFWLVAVDMNLSFEHTPNGTWLWIVHRNPLPYDDITDQWTLALLITRLRQELSIGEDLTAEVQLTHPNGDLSSRFTEIFGVPVTCGKQRAGILLGEGMWKKRLLEANVGLRDSLMSVADHISIKQFDLAPLSYTIRTRLPDAISENRFTIDDIASELGLSARTLQRHLAGEQITFKQLLDIFRQEQALDALRSGERSMVTIAYQLGYNEQSSFNRAFRRWTGKSPTEWLRAHPAG